MLEGGHAMHAMQAPHKAPRKIEGHENWRRPLNASVVRLAAVGDYDCSILTQAILNLILTK
jgi:hypothetical protein